MVSIFGWGVRWGSAWLALGLVSCLTQSEVRVLGKGSSGRRLEPGARQHLVCWNIHKAADEHLTREVGALVSTIPADEGWVLCLQEVRSTTFDDVWGLHCDDVAGHYAMSWRYPCVKHSTGVLTVSRGWGRPKRGERLLSPKRELWVTSPKVSLLSEWQMSSGVTLQVVNCHGLNFVSNPVFSRQLDQVFGVLAAGGPVLACGDFNTWSEERLRLLRERADAAGLEEVAAPAPSRIPGPKWPKALAAVSVYEPKLHLDRAFSRGLDILACEWREEPTRSDHLPFVVTFRLR